MKKWIAFQDQLLSMMSLIINVLIISLFSYQLFWIVFIEVLSIFYVFDFSSHDFNFFQTPLDELIKSIEAESIGEDGSQPMQNIKMPEDVDETQETQNVAAELTGGFKCTICGMLFKSISGRNHHIRSMHSNDPKYYYCRDCGENLITKLACWLLDSEFVFDWAFKFKTTCGWHDKPIDTTFAWETFNGEFALDWALKLEITCGWYIELLECDDFVRCFWFFWLIIPIIACFIKLFQFFLRFRLSSSLFVSNDRCSSNIHIFDNFFLLWSYRHFEASSFISSSSF